jgi:hypothetical protein
VDILVFLLTKRLKNFYSISNWKGTLSVFFFSVILMLYAIGVGFLYDYYTDKNLISSAQNVLTGVKIMLVVLPVSLKFFPSFTLKKAIISPHYPVSNFKIALIDFFAISFIKASNWILFAFIIVLGFSAKHLQTADTNTMYYYWLTGFLLSENIMNAVSWRKYLYLMLSVLTMAAVTIFAKYQPLLPLSVSGIYGILTINVFWLLANYFIFYKSDFEFEQARGYSDLNGEAGKSSSYLPLKLLWRNQKCRSALVIAFASKIGFLILFLSGTERYTFSQILHKVPFVLLLEPPIIVFTYVFNNIWGYFIDIQLNNIIINPSPKTQVKTYLNLVIPVLTIDFVIAMAAWACYGVLDPKIIIIYVVYTGYCLPLGFLSSFRKYFLVDLSINFSRFRGKTSQFYSFLMIAPAIALGFIYDTDAYLYIYLGILLTASVIISFYIKSTFDVHRQILKQSIFGIKPTANL